MVQVKYIRCLSTGCNFKKQVSGQPESDRLAREHRATTTKINEAHSGAPGHRDFLYVQATEVHV